MVEPSTPRQDDDWDLNCVIEGEYAVFIVTVGRNIKVSNLKKAIQCERQKSILADVDPHTLELWKPKDFIPTEPDDTLAERIVSLGGLSQFADKLGPTKRLASILSVKPADEYIHIIIKAPAIEPSESGKRQRVDDGGIDLSALQEAQSKRYRTGLNPSAVSKDARLMRSQQDYAEILNGRPWDRSGPPVGLYHPVFDRFLEYFKETTPGYRTVSPGDGDDSMPSIDDAFSFMKASSQFHDLERSGPVDQGPPTGRAEAVLPALSRLLGVSVPWTINSDGTEPGARVVARIPAGYDALSAIFELELESGIDGKTRVQQSYARTCSLPEHEPVRLISCSPCFLVEIAGPWITVFGAVYVQKVIVQDLTGSIYLQPHVLDPSSVNTPLRLFYALRRALRDLRQYYESLLCQPTSSRFFPFVRSYKHLSGATVDIDYKEPISPNESKATYLAKQGDGKEVVVKFAPTYNAHAHRLLADHGFAPELIYDGTEGPRYGGLLMIVMDDAKGRTLSRLLNSSPRPPWSCLDTIITSVKKAIELLHAKNLVFGDLRTPNILVNGDDMKLVDYDWCGVHGEDRYPFIIGDVIEWASGVGPLAIMDKAHDLHMLKKLEQNIRAGACAGVW